MPMYPANQPWLAYMRHHPYYSFKSHNRQLQRFIQKVIGSSQLELDELCRRVAFEYSFSDLKAPRPGEFEDELDHLVRTGGVERTEYGRYMIPRDRLEEVLGMEWVV